MAQDAYHFTGFNGKSILLSLIEAFLGKNKLIISVLFGLDAFVCYFSIELGTNQSSAIDT